MGRKGETELRLKSPFSSGFSGRRRQQHRTSRQDTTTHTPGGKRDDEDCERGSPSRRQKLTHFVCRVSRPEETTRGRYNDGDLFFSDLNERSCVLRLRLSLSLLHPLLPIRPAVPPPANSFHGSSRHTHSLTCKRLTASSLTRLRVCDSLCLSFHKKQATAGRLSGSGSSLPHAL